MQNATGQIKMKVHSPSNCRQKRFLCACLSNNRKQWTSERSKRVTKEAGPTPSHGPLCLYIEHITFRRSITSSVTKIVVKINIISYLFITVYLAVLTNNNLQIYNPLVVDSSNSLQVGQWFNRERVTNRQTDKFNLSIILTSVFDVLYECFQYNIRF